MSWVILERFNKGIIYKGRSRGRKTVKGISITLRWLIVRAVTTLDLKRWEKEMIRDPGEQIP